MANNQMLRAMRGAVESNAPLSNCSPEGHLRWKFDYSDATGAFYKTSLSYTCPGNDNYRGYNIDGIFWAEGDGAYQFTGIKLELAPE